jgi:hypothetical protein
VARLGIAAQNRQVLDGASRADVVGDLVDFSGERLGTGQAIANMRAQNISAGLCTTRVGSRRSGNTRANLSAKPRRRSAIARRITPSRSGDRRRRQL